MSPFRRQPKIQHEDVAQLFGPFPNEKTKNLIQRRHRALLSDEELDPFVPDETTRALWKRAIADPSSLSDEDRRTVSQRVSREEEDSRCRARCGLSMPELIAKAIHDTGSLSYNVLHLLIYPNVDYNMLQRRHRMSKADQDLLKDAMEAALTEDEIAARTYCLDMQGFWDAQKRAAQDALSKTDTGVIEAAGTKWLEHIIGLSKQKVATYGFVVFHSKEVNWSAFKEQIEAAIQPGINYLYIKEGLTLHDIQYDDSRSLQSRFISMRDGGDIPTGLRQDAFLYVDDEAWQSRLSDKPFIRLWEPDNEAEQFNEATPLKIAIKHIAPALIARLTKRDMPSDKGRKRSWRESSDLDQLHAEAGRSRDEDGKRDRIWPAGPRRLHESVASFDKSRGYIMY